MSATPATPTTPAPDAERRRGYHRWQGERTAQAWRWWVIARGNLALAWANRWVKFILIASLIPGIILAGITYFFIPLSAVVLDRVMDGTLLFAFLLAAIVGSRLVSEDRRQGAFLAHFSRPVTRIDYLAGKFVALFIPLVFVTSASAMLAIAADASIDTTTFADRIGAQNFSEFDTTGYLRQASYMNAVGAVIAWSLIVSATTTGIVLGLSALSTRARIAGVIWFAVVAFGTAAQGILQATLGSSAKWPALLSWMDNTQDLSSMIIGLDGLASMGDVLEYNMITRVLVLALAAIAGLAIVHEQLRRAEGGVK